MGRGSQGVPWLTVTVAAVTATGLLVQELVPGTLAALQRSPAATTGEPWRWLTALVVQDGWLAGGVVNLAGLVLAGTALERCVRRPVWLAAYVLGGLAGQVFGHAWQPVGGGNSVAVCGLVGLLVVLLATGRTDGRLPRLVPPVWIGALAAAAWWPLALAGVLVGSLGSGVLERRRLGRPLVVGFSVLGALVLLASRDLHGGALVTAFAASVVAVRVGAIDIL